MNHTVIWRPSAAARLAELWISASDREAVSAAADEIDAKLRTDPASQGESRWDATRILINPPLAIYFDVAEHDRLAIVWAVWRSK
jgi:plasmid stabilization system protein ParE